MTRSLQPVIVVAAAIAVAAQSGCDASGKEPNPTAITGSSRAPDRDSAPGPRHEEFLENYVHYVLIARPVLANAWYETLANSGLTDGELVTLVDEMLAPASRRRLEEALRLAARVPELQDGASELSARIERGRAEVTPTAQKR